MGATKFLKALAFLVVMSEVLSLANGEQIISEEIPLCCTKIPTYGIKYCPSSYWTLKCNDSNAFFEFDFPDSLARFRQDEDYK